MDFKKSSGGFKIPYSQLNEKAVNRQKQAVWRKVYKTKVEALEPLKER